MVMAAGQANLRNFCCHTSTLTASAGRRTGAVRGTRGSGTDAPLPDVHGDIQLPGCAAVGGVGCDQPQTTSSASVVQSGARPPSRRCDEEGHDRAGQQRGSDTDGALRSRRAPFALLADLVHHPADGMALGRQSPTRHLPPTHPAGDCPRVGRPAERPVEPCFEIGAERQIPRLRSQFEGESERQAAIVRDARFARSTK